MIKNRDQLLSHGCVKGRRLAADIIDHCLNEVDPYKATRETMRYERKTQINRIEWHYFINGKFDSIQNLDMRLFFPQE